MNDPQLESVGGGWAWLAPIGQRLAGNAAGSWLDGGLGNIPNDEQEAALGGMYVDVNGNYSDVYQDDYWDY